MLAFFESICKTIAAVSHASRSLIRSRAPSAVKNTRYRKLNFTTGCQNSLSFAYFLFSYCADKNFRIWSRASCRFGLGLSLPFSSLRKIQRSQVRLWRKVLLPFSRHFRFVLFLCFDLRNRDKVFANYIGTRAIQYLFYTAGVEKLV